MIKLSVKIISILVLIAFIGAPARALTLDKIFRDVEVVLIKVSITSGDGFSIEPKMRWAISKQLTSNFAALLRNKVNGLIVNVDNGEVGTLTIRLHAFLCCKVDNKLFVSTDYRLSRVLKKWSKFYTPDVHTGYSGLHGFIIENPKNNLAEKLSHELGLFISGSFIAALEHTRSIEKSFKE